MKVSTIILAYNQDKFLSDAIESAIEQIGDFSHEILISDDGSSDNTKNIISKYSKKYPKLIKDISNNINYGIKKNYFHCLTNCSGNFISILEGDDFWINKKKIQTQVNFLKNNKEVSLVFCKSILLNYETGELRLLNRQKNLNKILTGEDFINQKNINYIVNLSSVMIRSNTIKDLLEKFESLNFSEITLAFYFDNFSKIGFIEKPMNVYRQIKNSDWYGQSSLEKKKREMKIRQDILKICKPEYKKKISNIISSYKYIINSIK